MLIVNFVPALPSWNNLNSTIFFAESVYLIFNAFFISRMNDYPENKKGRKGYTTKEKIFCMAIKIFYRSDLRKCESMLKELKRLGYLSRVPCFKSLDNFFNDKDLSLILDDLILISALPFAQMEVTGAIDSTGFSVSRFERWNDYKWGKHTGKERVWRKAHAVVGCMSNTVLHVKITEKNESDVSNFEEVIGNRTRFFRMENFVADKAYSSRKIFKIIQGLNMTPYFPFKKNATGKAGGCSIWRKMYQEFKYNNEEFMRKYHKRSNVETTFHMIKQRFGDHLLTKKFAANINEIKVKFLCHNICVLIQELYETEISIDFESCVKMNILCKN